MITKLVVSNYRSLGESVEIPLGQLTALVGINSAGKSAILDVLRFVSECVRDGVAPALIKRNGLGAIRRRCNIPNLPITIRTESSFEVGQATWEFSLQADERGDYFVSHEKCRWEPNHEGVRDYWLKLCRRRVSAPEEPLREELQSLITKLEAGEFLDAGLMSEFRPCYFEAANDELTEFPLGEKKQSSRSDQTALLLPLRRETQFKRVADSLRNIACYTIFPDQLRPPQKPDVVRRPMDEAWRELDFRAAATQKRGCGSRASGCTGKNCRRYHRLPRHSRRRLPGY